MPTNEERLARIEATLEHMATKEDMQSLRAELIKWMVGTGIGVAGVAATLAAVLMRFLVE
jgi:hypothetical protein